MDALQSWWEVPSVAQFCWIFHDVFNLRRFHIEELEKALLSQTENSDSFLLIDIICCLLRGCYPRKDIRVSNYEQYLQDIVKNRLALEHGLAYPLEKCDFCRLPLRGKVEILQALCNYRLDASDSFDALKELESDSLRIDPVGRDRHGAIYWRVLGTRMYREDGLLPDISDKDKNGKKKIKERRKLTTKLPEKGKLHTNDATEDSLQRTPRKSHKKGKKLKKKYNETVLDYSSAEEYSPSKRYVGKKGNKLEDAGNFSSYNSGHECERDSAVECSPQKTSERLSSRKSSGGFHNLGFQTDSFYLYDDSFSDSSESDSVMYSTTGECRPEVKNSSTGPSNTGLESVLTPAVSNLSDGREKDKEPIEKESNAMDDSLNESGISLRRSTRVQRLALPYNSALYSSSSAKVSKQKQSQSKLDQKKHMAKSLTRETNCMDTKCVDTTNKTQLSVGNTRKQKVATKVTLHRQKTKECRNQISAKVQHKNVTHKINNDAYTNTRVGTSLNCSVDETEHTESRLLPTKNKKSRSRQTALKYPMEKLDLNASVLDLSVPSKPVQNKRMSIQNVNLKRGLIKKNVRMKRNRDCRKSMFDLAMDRNDLPSFESNIPVQCKSTNAMEKGIDERTCHRGNGIKLESHDARTCNESCNESSVNSKILSQQKDSLIKNRSQSCSEEVEDKVNLVTSNYNTSSLCDVRRVGRDQGSGCTSNPDGSVAVTGKHSEKQSFVDINRPTCEVKDAIPSVHSISSVTQDCAKHIPDSTCGQINGFKCKVECNGENIQNKLSLPGYDSERSVSTDNCISSKEQVDGAFDSFEFVDRDCCIKYEKQVDGMYDSSDFNDVTTERHISRKTRRIKRRKYRSGSETDVSYGYLKKDGTVADGHKVLTRKLKSRRLLAGKRSSRKRIKKNRVRRNMQKLESVRKLESQQSFDLPLAGQSSDEEKNRGIVSPVTTRWRLVCTTYAEWRNLAEQFRGSEDKCERKLFTVLMTKILPELPELFERKENEIKSHIAERKQLYQQDLGPPRTSCRLEIKRVIKEQKEAALAVCLVAAQQRKEQQLPERKLRLIDRHAEPDTRTQLVKEDKEKAKRDRERRAQEREHRASQRAELKAKGAAGGPRPPSSIVKPRLHNDVVASMRTILQVVRNHSDAWLFYEPVDESIAPGYHDVIEKPMDLLTIEKKISKKAYTSSQEFIDDFKLMFNNCYQYNGKESEYSTMADNVHNSFLRAMNNYLPPNAHEGDGIPRSAASLHPQLVGHPLGGSVQQPNRDNMLRSPANMLHQMPTYPLGGNPHQRTDSESGFSDEEVKQPPKKQRRKNPKGAKNAKKGSFMVVPEPSPSNSGEAAIVRVTNTSRRPMSDPFSPGLRQPPSWNQMMSGQPSADGQQNGRSPVVDISPPGRQSAMLAQQHGMPQTLHSPYDHRWRMPYGDPSMLRGMHPSMANGPRGFPVAPGMPPTGYPSNLSGQMFPQGQYQPGAPYSSAGGFPGFPSALSKSGGLPKPPTGRDPSDSPSPLSHHSQMSNEAAGLLQRPPSTSSRSSVQDFTGGYGQTGLTDGSAMAKTPESHDENPSPFGSRRGSAQGSGSPGISHSLQIRPQFTDEKRAVSGLDKCSLDSPAESNSQNVNTLGFDNKMSSSSGPSQTEYPSFQGGPHFVNAGPLGALSGFSSSTSHAGFSAASSQPGFSSSTSQPGFSMPGMPRFPFSSTASPFTMSSVGTKQESSVHGSQQVTPGQVLPSDGMRPTPVPGATSSTGQPNLERNNSMKQEDSLLMEGGGKPEGASEFDGLPSNKNCLDDDLLDDLLSPQGLNNDDHESVDTAQINVPDIKSENKMTSQNVVNTLPISETSPPTKSGLDSDIDSNGENLDESFSESVSAIGSSEPNFGNELEKVSSPANMLNPSDCSGPGKPTNSLPIESSNLNGSDIAGSSGKTGQVEGCPPNVTRGPPVTSSNDWPAWMARSSNIVRPRVTDPAVFGNMSLSASVQAQSMGPHGAVWPASRAAVGQPVRPRFPPHSNIPSTQSSGSGWGLNTTTAIPNNADNNPYLASALSDNTPASVESKAGTVQSFPRMPCDGGQHPSSPGMGNVPLASLPTSGTAGAESSLVTTMQSAPVAQSPDSKPENTALSPISLPGDLASQQAQANMALDKPVQSPAPVAGNAPSTVTTSGKIAETAVADVPSIHSPLLQNMSQAENTQTVSFGNISSPAPATLGSPVVQESFPIASSETPAQSQSLEYKNPMATNAESSSFINEKPTMSPLAAPSPGSTSLAMPMSMNVKPVSYGTASPLTAATPEASVQSQSPLPSNQCQVSAQENLSASTLTTSAAGYLQGIPSDFPAQSSNQSQYSGFKNSVAATGENVNIYKPSADLNPASLQQPFARDGNGTLSTMAISGNSQAAPSPAAVTQCPPSQPGSHMLANPTNVSCHNSPSESFIQSSRGISNMQPSHGMANIPPSSGMGNVALSSLSASGYPTRNLNMSSMAPTSISPLASDLQSYTASNMNNSNYAQSAGSAYSNLQNLANFARPPLHSQVAALNSMAGGPMSNGNRQNAPPMPQTTQTTSSTARSRKASGRKQSKASKKNPTTDAAMPVSSPYMMPSGAPSYTQPRYPQSASFGQYGYPSGAMSTSQQMALQARFSMSQMQNRLPMNPPENHPGLPSQSWNPNSYSQFPSIPNLNGKDSRMMGNEMNLMPTNSNQSLGFDRKQEPFAMEGSAAMRNLYMAGAPGSQNSNMAIMQGMNGNHSNMMQQPGGNPFGSLDPTKGNQPDKQFDSLELAKRQSLVAPESDSTNRLLDLDNLISQNQCPSPKVLLDLDSYNPGAGQDSRTPLSRPFMDLEGFSSSYLNASPKQYLDLDSQRVKPLDGSTGAPPMNYPGRPPSYDMSQFSQDSRIPSNAWPYPQQYQLGGGLSGPMTRLPAAAMMGSRMQSGVPSTMTPQGYPMQQHPAQPSPLTYSGHPQVRPQAPF